MKKIIDLLMEEKNVPSVYLALSILLNLLNEPILAIAMSLCALTSLLCAP